jgi:hypothetical protein
MSAFLPFPGVDLFSSGYYRLVNVSLPVCLLDSKDGGYGGSDALTPAALTISAGKIHQIAIGSRPTLESDMELGQYKRKGEKFKLANMFGVKFVALRGRFERMFLWRAPSCQH